MRSAAAPPGRCLEAGTSDLCAGNLGKATVRAEGTGGTSGKKERLRGEGERETKGEMMKR